MKGVANAKKTHAAEKPTEILEHFLRAAALPGDMILDPCCGSGSIFKAGYNLNLKVTGIELSEQYYQQALATLGDIRDGKTDDEPEAFDEDDEDEDLENLLD